MPEDGRMRPKHVVQEYKSCIQDDDNTYIQKINGNATRS
jgi:hypothetical protein